MTDLALTLVHLYPNLMNLYGDRGNIVCLLQRAAWRGIVLTLETVTLGEHLKPDTTDMLFMGGGQDAQQCLIADDLIRKQANPIRDAVAQGAVMLGICGGYQLMGHGYTPHEGRPLQGLSLMDVNTVAGSTRMIGNVVIERLLPDGTTMTVVGFENHSGVTTLGPSVAPLGRVRVGSGNNGQDGTEGAVVGNLYGTYLHGSLLPKNPQLADELLIKALQRRYGGDAVLPPLLPEHTDKLETAAHLAAASRRAS